MLHLIISYTLLLAFFVITSMCLILKFRRIEEEIDDRNETVDELHELITENTQLIGETTLVLEEACDKITKLRFERKLDRSLCGFEHKKQTEKWIHLGSEISKMKDQIYELQLKLGEEEV